MKPEKKAICEKCGYDLTEYLGRVGNIIAPGTKSSFHLCPGVGCTASYTVENRGPIQEVKSEVFLSFATEETWGTKPMTWTSEKPTVPGWYWYKADMENLEIVSVKILDYILCQESMMDVDELQNIVGSWYGPLEVPK